VREVLELHHRREIEMNLKVASLACALAMVAGAVITNPAAAQERTLHVGADADYRPISYPDPSGKMIGFDVDFATALAAHMGRKLQYEGMAWDGIIPALQAKKIDAVTDLVITDKRKEVVAFSSPYVAQTITTVVRTDKPNFNPGRDDLAKLRVGVMVSTAAANALQKIPGVNPTTYNTVADEYNDLLLGRIDVVAIESSNGAYVASATYPGKLRVTGQTLSDEKSLAAVAVRKDDTALLDEVNVALAKMKADGSLKATITKWFGDDRQMVE
jgi:ABC-type amino acid transport substrate-binding protein